MPEFVRLDGGTFVMGNTGIDPEHHEFFPDEVPLKVHVDPFSISRTVVSAEQFCQFLNAPELRGEPLGLYYELDGEREHKWSSIALEDGRFAPRADAANSPANRVTWLGAVRYTRWLTERTGTTYRLPTEAEWEFAARGTASRQWPWGDEPPYKLRPGLIWLLKVEEPDATRGDRSRWRKWTGEPWPKYALDAYPAGATPEGVLGLLGDTAGEWCINVYRPNPTAEQVTDATIDLTKLNPETPRVMRGGYHRRAVTNPPWVFKANVWIEGRVWTRIHQSPVGGDLNALGDAPAVATFRLVRPSRP